MKSPDMPHEKMIMSEINMANETSDLIYRQAAIDAIQEHKKNVIGFGYDSAHNDICDVISALPSAQPEPHWISVSERLPEEGELVLLCFRSAKDTPYRRVQVGYLGNHDVEDYDFQKIGVAQVWYTDRFYWSFDKVVAWMPLLKPYEG